MPEQPIIESTGGGVPIKVIFEYLKKLKGLYKFWFTGEDVEFSVVFHDGEPIIAGGRVRGSEYHGTSALTTAGRLTYEKLIVYKIEDNRHIFPNGSLTQLIPPLKAGDINIDSMIRDIRMEGIGIVLSSENWTKIICLKKEGITFIGVKPPKIRGERYSRRMISNVEELLITTQPVIKRKVLGVFEPSEYVNIFQASNLLTKQIIVQEKLTVFQP